MGFNIQQYELGAIRDNVDYNSWSNATGYTKAELISKIRTAKDSIEKWTNDRNSAQVRYDEANARYCADGCGKRKNAPCHGACWSKTRDKDSNLGILNSTTLEINTAQANIPIWQNELDDLIEKEANTPTPNTGSGASVNPIVTTSIMGAGLGTFTSNDATTKNSKTKNYLIIGGAVLVLVIVGFLIIRKK
jgi:hypothetical protein